LIKYIFRKWLKYPCSKPVYFINCFCKECVNNLV